MNREQMRAALKSINNVESDDKALTLGILVADVQAWATDKVVAAKDSSLGVVDGIVIGYKYQRALNKGTL